jgi:hypothetical protein
MPKKELAPLTIQVLTLPDGSKRRCLSRPVGDPRMIYEWMVLEAADNPKRWLDLEDLHRFVYIGEPARMTAGLVKTLRGFLKGAHRYAIEHHDDISKKTDSKGGIVKFKIWRRKSVAEKYQLLKDTAKNYALEQALDRRVNSRCETLETDESQLADMIRKGPPPEDRPESPDDNPPAA